MTGTLATYAFERPTAESSITAMAKLLGREEAERAWSRAQAAAAVEAEAPSLDQLFVIVDHLKAVPPPLNAVAATSMRVRLLSYRALEALQRMKEGAS